jgi:hypothetical protein
MDLVEDHARRTREMMGEQVRRRRHLLIGDDNPMRVRVPRPIGVSPPRIEMQPDEVGHVRPLRTQRGGRRDYDHLLTARRASRLARRKRLPRPGRRDQQIIHPVARR